MFAGTHAAHAATSGLTPSLAFAGMLTVWAAAMFSVGAAGARRRLDS